MLRGLEDKTHHLVVRGYGSEMEVLAEWVPSEGCEGDPVPVWWWLSLAVLGL